MTERQKLILIVVCVTLTVGALIFDPSLLFPWGLALLIGLSRDVEEEEQ